MSDEHEAATAWERLVLVAILATAAFLRVAYVSELRGAPDFEHPFVDAGFHDNWARSIAFEDWSRPAHLADPELETTPYLRPPGYPFFLSLVYSAAGRGYLAPRVVQSLLGLAAVLLLYRLGRRLAGPGVGLGAALLFGTAWVPIYFEGEFHAPSLLIVLLLGLWNLAADWLRSPGWGRAALAGVVLGLAGLVRPNVLALLPLVFAVGAWALARARASVSGGQGAALAPPSRTLQGLAFALACCLPILPVTLRNLRASGEFVPITTGMGVNLFIGNNPQANGRISGELPGLGRFETCYDYPAVVASLEARLGRDLSQREVSSWFADQAFDFMRREPGRAAALTLLKLRLALGAGEVSHNKVLTLERDHSAVLSRLPGPFPLYVAGGLIGCAWWWSDRRRAGRTSAAQGDSAGGGEPRRDGARTELGVLLALSALALLASLLPFFAAARYRVPLYPLASLFAAYAGVGLWRSLRSRRWGSAAAAASGYALLAAALMAGSPNRAGSEDLAKWHCDRGRSLRRDGDLTAAEAEYRAALEVRPARADVHYEYALLLIDQGRRDDARQAYRRAIELDPERMLPHYNLGTLLAEEGAFDEALAALEQAVRLEPRYAPAHLNIAKLHFNAGDGRSALDACERLLAFDPGHPEARSLAAMTCERLGQRARAMELYGSLLDHPAASAAARQKLAWILATAPEDELRDGRRALQLLEGLVGPSAGPELLGTLAAALAETGDFERALQVAERGLQLAGDRGQGRRGAVLAGVAEACRARRPVRTPR